MEITITRGALYILLASAVTAILTRFKDTPETDFAEVSKTALGKGVLKSCISHASASRWNRSSMSQVHVFSHHGSNSSSSIVSVPGRETYEQLESETQISHPQYGSGKSWNDSAHFALPVRRQNHLLELQLSSLNSVEWCVATHSMGEHGPAWPLSTHPNSVANAYS